MAEIVLPQDLRVAADACCAVLEDVVDRDWSVLAGELSWSCRQTLDHIPNALVFYSSQLALSAKERLPRTRDGGDGLSIPELLVSIKVTAAILEKVVAGSSESTRAFHPAGMADPSGFAAMGCDEMLIHTADIAAGFNLEWLPPSDLSKRIGERLFPWAPRDCDPWQSLLWANGRIALPGLGRQDESWYWHCAPLDEWNGEVSRRTIPPGG